MTRWSPFGSVFQLHREIDDLFNRFLGSTWSEPGRAAVEEAAVPAWWPAVESYVQDGTLCVRAALPGVDPKDVEVAVTENVLTIKGERKGQAERREGSFYLRELSYGGFERNLVLPEGIDASKVTARYANGMLEVSMPAPLAVAPKKVDIRIEGPTTEPKAIRVA